MDAKEKETVPTSLKRTGTQKASCFKAMTKNWMRRSLFPRIWHFQESELKDLNGKFEFNNHWSN